MKKIDEKKKIDEYCKSKNIEFLVWAGRGYLNVFSGEFLAPEKLAPYQGPGMNSYSHSGSSESRLAVVSRQWDVLKNEYRNIKDLGIGKGVKLQDLRGMIDNLSSDTPKYCISGTIGYGIWPGICFKPYQFFVKRPSTLERSKELKYLRYELRNIVDNTTGSLDRHFADNRTFRESPTTLIGWREDSGEGKYEDFETGSAIDPNRIIPLGLPCWLGIDRNSFCIGLQRKNYGDWVRFGQNFQDGLNSDRVKLNFAVNACIGNIVPKYTPTKEEESRGRRSHEEYFYDLFVQPCFLLPEKKFS